MGDGTTIKVLGRGTIDLKFTLGKILTLQNIQHVSTIRKNLLRSFLLIQLGFKVVLEFNKVIISKKNIFIENNFMSEELFKLNIIFPPKINKSSINSSTSLVLNSKYYETWIED